MLQKTVNIMEHDSGDQTTFLILAFQKMFYPSHHCISPPKASTFTFAAETNSTRGGRGKKGKETMTENKVVKAIEGSVGISRAS
jgi:hypothetical protein